MARSRDGFRMYSVPGNPAFRNTGRPEPPCGLIPHLRVQVARPRLRLRAANRGGLTPVPARETKSIRRGELMLRLGFRTGIAAAVLSLALVAAASAAPPEGSYRVTPLASDIPGVAPTTDPNLVNGWGLARSATSPWWVADNE